MVFVHDTISPFVKGRYAHEEYTPVVCHASKKGCMNKRIWS